MDIERYSLRVHRSGVGRGRRAQARPSELDVEPSEVTVELADRLCRYLEARRRPCRLQLLASPVWTNPAPTGRRVSSAAFITAEGGVAGLKARRVCLRHGITPNDGR